MNVETEERAEIAATLRGSVERSALTRAQFARCIGTSATRLSTYLSGKTIPSAAIYVRALRLGDALEQARQRGLVTPDDVAGSVNCAMAEGDEDFALRLILQARDDLRTAVAEGDALGPVWVRRAKQIEDNRFDTLFRAIIAHEFGERVPAWAADARLDEDWIVGDPFRDADTIRKQTPEWLARAHIYIAERGLTTA